MTKHEEVSSWSVSDQGGHEGECPDSDSKTDHTRPWNITVSLASVATGFWGCPHPATCSVADSPWGGLPMTAVAPLFSQPVATVQIQLPSVRKGRRSPWTGTLRSSAALCTSAVSPGWTWRHGRRGSRDICVLSRPFTKSLPRDQWYYYLVPVFIILLFRKHWICLLESKNPSKYKKMKILSSYLLDVSLSTL